MRVIQMNPSSSPIKQQAAAFSPADKTEAVKAPVFDIKHFKEDDWIILGIIAALVFEGSDDYLLLCALGYLFLVGL